VQIRDVGSRLGRREKRGRTVNFNAELGRVDSHAKCNKWFREKG